jgi:hypothetical protein
MNHHIAFYKANRENKFKLDKISFCYGWEASLKNKNSEEILFLEQLCSVLQPNTGIDPKIFVLDRLEKIRLSIKK